MITLSRDKTKILERNKNTLRKSKEGKSIIFIKKKSKFLLALFAVAMLSSQAVSAASVSFSNFSYTTVPETEMPVAVASKAKADNEQNWYVTFTSKSGFSNSSCRGLVTSNTRVSSIDTKSALYGIFSNTTRIVAPYYAETYVPKGTTCSLILTGNCNEEKSYVLNISGRYTS